MKTESGFCGARTLNSVSRRRSLVGRMARPDGTCSLRLRYFPAMTRMGNPFYVEEFPPCRSETKARQGWGHAKRAYTSQALHSKGFLAALGTSQIQCRVAVCCIRPYAAAIYLIRRRL